MKMKKLSEIKWVLFGTSDFVALLLEELKKTGFLPTLIVTAPDKPKGRKLVLTPPPIKRWAATNNISVLQPEKLRDENFLNKLGKDWDLFVVAAYGKIIPKAILDIPKHGSLNIHPSLLPKYRGPSPLQFQILNDEENIGVSIIKIDEEVDHGPIVAQEKIELLNWPISFKKLEKETAISAAKLLQGVLPQWLSQKITLAEQNHAEATFTRLLKKEDGLLDLKDNPYKNYLKFLAYEEWPGAYFFAEQDNKKIRVKITSADFESTPTPRFKIRRGIPENRHEMSYDDFLKSLNNSKPR
jgi:methionyl-tRNA formyltransferase